MRSEKFPWPSFQNRYGEGCAGRGTSGRPPIDHAAMVLRVGRSPAGENQVRKSVTIDIMEQDRRGPLGRESENSTALCGTAMTPATPVS